MDEKGIDADALFAGCTRPATYAGVPLSAFIVEMLCVLEVFIWSGNILYLLSIIPLHGVFYLICMREPRTFELLLLWLFTKGRNFLSWNWFFWKSSTYSPLDLGVGASIQKQKRKMRQ